MTFTTNPTGPGTATPTRIALTVGPVQYYWPRNALMHFYAEVAESAADTVVLGEVVCARRHEMKQPDWLALARELHAAGKEVVLATQALIESDADLRLVQRLCEQPDFLLEAGDASALNRLTLLQRPFVLGPHINVYNAPALHEYRRLGAVRWVAPAELSLAAIARVLGRGAGPGLAGAQALPAEVLGYGRLPLAFSARCFTARHHRLAKDQCEFRCNADADGLLLSTTDGEPFLVLNGIQTQSAGVQCLLGAQAALRQAGVSRLRLSPTSRGFAAVIDAFDQVMNHGADAAALLPALAAASPGALVDGFAGGRPGVEAVAA